MSGAVSFHAGLSAEAAVAAHYVREGYTVAERRWRGSGGEIDLILRQGAAVVFVEVKKSRSFASAALRVSGRQLARIMASAQEFLAREPAALNTEARVDVALVDEVGRVSVIRNVGAG